MAHAIVHAHEGNGSKTATAHESGAPDKPTDTLNFKHDHAPDTPRQARATARATNFNTTTHLIRQTGKGNAPDKKPAHHHAPACVGGARPTISRGRPCEEPKDHGKILYYMVRALMATQIARKPTLVNGTTP